jgi:hypothetical protein
MQTQSQVPMCLSSLLLIKKRERERAGREARIRGDGMGGVREVLKMMGEANVEKANGGGFAG